ncbi:zinc finger translocation-associated protein isoform X2 [Hippocampus zosterae]|uniref:zinc finger translocation-associated protein isoform X2 n=1 Tax=Hippocampus zosterae TaxID=109293 RepID=UPI00223D26DF|nr:zinc finger translocation-associated protein isoform X2 [Hippocampus zosterae]
MDDATELRGAERARPRPEPLSLTVRGEEEEEEDEAARGHSHSGEDALSNGHATQDECEADSAVLAGPVRSPGTSYWSISEGPDRPPILSPAPGPSGRKVRRASRPGLSRIPGRDHRRYYHEYWRSEYLMDFDPLRHGMICMVCGSSLATLKLSTIKRHIRQKHPDSLLWSPADKEVIRSGWESHLSLGARPVRTSPRGHPEADGEELADDVGAAAPEAQPQQRRSLSPGPEATGDEAGDEAAAAAEARTLECYLNASLHAWFRQEFLMEYEAEAGRLLCMLCGGQLPSLHLDHIKSHVLQRHPDSLVYSSEQKHCVLQAWAHTHDESENSIQSEAIAKDEADGGTWDASPSRDGGATGDDDGGVEAPRPGTKRRRGACGDSWQLRLDYLVAYGPRGRHVYCMVCSQALRGTQVRSFRRHIQECHPETFSLSQREREARAAAWTKDYCADGILAQDEISTSDAAVLNTGGGPNENSSPDTKSAVKEEEDDEEEEDDGGGGGGGGVKDAAKDATPRHSHYPGKDQRRNYQVRWRTDFLMDYDCRRHGLICMVCGAALATLKVSTIKRHIQQVHAHSLRYGDDERRRATLAYDRDAALFAHAEDCFLSRDHARAETGHLAT